MNFTRKILALGLLIFSATSFAQGGASGGNGGDGVRINGVLHLLDFVEAGIESNDSNFKILVEKYQKEKSAEKEQFERTWSYTFTKLPFDSEVKTAVMAKAYSLNRAYRGGVMSPLHLFSWSLVSAEFQNISDEDTFIKLPLVQLAVRQGAQIMIARAFFDQLSLYEKVGLIFHECFYAIVEPTPINGGLFTQKSKSAREANSNFFQQNDIFNPLNLAQFCRKRVERNGLMECSEYVFDFAKDASTSFKDLGHFQNSQWNGFLKITPSSSPQGNEILVYFAPILEAYTGDENKAILIGMNFGLSAKNGWRNLETTWNRLIEKSPEAHILDFIPSFCESAIQNRAAEIITNARGKFQSFSLDTYSDSDGLHYLIRRSIISWEGGGGATVQSFHQVKLLGLTQAQCEQKVFEALTLSAQYLHEITHSEY